MRTRVLTSATAGRRLAARIRFAQVSAGMGERNLCRSTLRRQAHPLEGISTSTCLSSPL